MNLADYEKMDTSSESHGDFIKFEKTGDTKYLRFLYKSGGATMGEDISLRRKKWDDEAKKYVYDTEDGQLVAVLDCIEYNEDGSNPRRVRWEKSAYFCKNTLLPMFRNFPRIIDGVWKITATNPKTKDAAYALFPIMNADTIKFPIIEEEQKSAEQQTTQAAAQPTVQAAEPAPQPAKKKYWE